MAGNGAEKRKADEMTADSVQVPLAEVKDLAEKGGENAAGTYITHRANAVRRVHVPVANSMVGAAPAAVGQTSHGTPAEPS